MVISKKGNGVYYRALIHDIGKIAIPMEYLVTPRKLTVTEYEIMKTHVAIGNKIIEHMDFPWDIKSVVYLHLECNVLLN
ncbi:HD-GYP domain-containing protein [Legionella longbeachae]|uniref:HD-GYP domain-containing protein n=1 Tax=Legionella longbeachae TaxID=450 RepID=UPI001CD950FD